jgi:hypothetical protein
MNFSRYQKFAAVLAALLVSFGSLSARAGGTPNEMPMAIKTSGAPAIDLVYQGRQIDRDEAVDLAKKGIDLSTIDPEPNDTWQPAPLPLSNAAKFSYPPESSQVHFLNDIEPNGMYRGQVEYYGRPFRLVVDMDGRQAIMNAALLRSLGYPVDMPKAYRELSIRFDSLDQMKNFIDNFAFETEFSRDRWIKKSDEKNLILTLRDVNLEYPRIDVQQLYNGKINTAWIAGHRAMRALIIPLMLLDVRLSENSVNIFPWEFTRIFAENIMLSHGYVSAFKETTYEDTRWIARKIALLGGDGAHFPTPEQAKAALKAIIDQAGYPPDVAALLLEKITARRNHMVQIFDIAKEIPANLVKLPYDVNLSIGAIVKGEATQEYYPDFAARFTVGDPDSPLRWSELKHYLKMETLAQGIQAITSKINQELQFKSAVDGVDAHKKDLIDAVIDHFKAHPNDPYVVPLKPWVEPLYGLNINASRSLVTGTYYGSDSKAQLVDNLIVGANIGAFGGIDGRKYLQNFGFGGSVSYQRTYTHVRPIPSLEAVKNEKWKNLFVPSFLRSTSKVLTWKIVHRKFLAFEGAYDEAQRAWAVSYPKVWPRYQKALATYKETKKKVCAAEGYPAPYEKCKLDPKLYPQPVDPTPDMKGLYEKEIGSPLPVGREIPMLSSDPKYPSVLPDDLEDTVVLGTLKDFLGDVRDNEVYTITDSVVNQVSPQIQIPLTTLAGMGVMDLVGKDLYGKIAPAVGVSVTGQWAILKRLMFMRKGDQFTVYDTRMNTRMLGGAANFTAWVELAKVAANKKKGTADTKALMLDLGSVTDDDKAKDDKLAADRKHLLMAIADLMYKNEIGTAEEIAPPYAIHHKLTGKERSAKVLLWNWANYAETHKVTLTPPADPLHPFDPGEQSRTLYSARKMNLSGKNPYGLMGQVLTKAVGVSGLLDSGTNQNPSGTFLGAANWSQVRAESEITPGREFKPMIILEDYYSGWFLAKDKLLKILDRIQGEVNALNLGSPIFRKDMFNSTTQLQAYEIRSNIVLYPSGVERLEHFIFDAKTRQQLLYTMLDWVDPADYRKRCRSYFSDKKIEPELAEFETIKDSKIARKTWNRCIQPWMRKVMRHVRRAPPRDHKEKYTEWLSSTVYLINRHLDVSRFLNRIGKDNFFLQVRVSGFRKGDENAQNKNGETDYLTDTIGTIQSPISLGPFRDLTVYTHGKDWQVSDYELQARYFGDGL